MFDYRRTHNCGALNRNDLGTTVTLSGWVNRRRDHGGLIFIDLRDRFGITQLIIDPNLPHATKLRSEWVISIKGKVALRATGMANPKLPTGEIEITVADLEILSQANTPPFSICDEEIDVNEELRLKYRYLDLRRSDLTQKLILRHKVMMETRKYFDANGFLEIQTPILCKSTPGGARHFLVPSRTYPGNFYGLAESPQIFKQLLMIGGMDRYFQIAQCFRDEDMRSDRQPEFTQIDVEMSFGKPQDLMHLIEGLVKQVFKQCGGIELHHTFPHFTYQECVENYGTDRPDLRFGMPLVRIDSIAKRSTFTVFQEQLDTGGCVKALCVKQGSEISRKDIDGYTQFVSKFGLHGLAWMKRQEEGLASHIVKHFSEDLQQELQTLLKVDHGDLILMAAGPEDRVNQALDHLRRHIAKERGLIPEGSLEFLWVTEFPMFRYNVDAKRLESEHHPFTSPIPEDVTLLNSEPLKVRTLAYDLVLNGYEIAGGSQRIHDGALQEKVFGLLQLTPGEIKEKFGFFIEALNFGTPPHLGIAFGLDRLIMLLGKTENIRDVIAFPKTQKASDLMIQCPSPVAPSQIKDLKIQVETTDITWI